MVKKTRDTISKKTFNGTNHNGALVRNIKLEHVPK